LMLLPYFFHLCYPNVPQIAQVTRRMKKSYHGAGAKGQMNCRVSSLAHNEMDLRSGHNAILLYVFS